MTFLPRRKPREQEETAGAVRAMGDLLEELRRTSQSMTGSLDRRAEELRALLAEADRRIARLEALGGGAPPPVPPASVPAGGSAGGPDPAPELRGVFDTVYREADGGRSLSDIARETGLNKGAVQLILGLREGARPSTDGRDRPGASL